MWTFRSSLRLSIYQCKIKGGAQLSISNVLSSDYKLYKGTIAKTKTILSTTEARGFARLTSSMYMYMELLTSLAFLSEFLLILLSCMKLKAQVRLPV